VLLLDTCVLLWLASRPGRLSRPARAALDDPGRDLFFSDASVWEICLKWLARKIVLPVPPRRCVEEQTVRWGIAELPIERSHLYRATELPQLHRDPFDRLLVAQALEAGLTVVTPDPAVRAYPVATLW